MPFLEIGMAESVTLCKAVQRLMEEKGVGLDDIIRLKGFVRLLFSASIELRVWSLRHVTPFLLSSDAPPPWSQSTTPLHDVLTLGEYHGGLLGTNQSSFQYEDVIKLVRILRSQSMDESLKKSALDQLSLILRDQQLHEQVLQDDLPDDLLSILVLHCTPPNESPRSLVKPCVKCLLLLTFSSPPLRERLAEDFGSLTAILRAALFFIEDKEFLCSVSMLLATALFGPVVKVTADGQVQLPKALAIRLKLPFPVVEYELEEHHLTPSPLDPKLFTSDPLLSMLRLYYHSAMTGPPDKIIAAHQNNVLHSTDEKITLPSSDISSLRSLSVVLILRECFDKLRGASSHSEVARLLHRIGVVLWSWTVYGDRVDLDSLQCAWRDTFQRFLTVSPSSPDDLSLLATVLEVLQTLTLVSLPRPLQPGMPDYLMQRGGLEWLCGVTCTGEAMCVKLLKEYVDNAHQKKLSSPHRLVIKRILSLTATLLHRTHPTPSLPHSSWSTLTQTLCQCVDVTGSQDCYDLPLLEASLKCLFHLTASNVADKTLRQDQVRKLLLRTMTSLRQVLWSLVSGRGFVTTSFLGRGVTSSASLTLTHIAQMCSLLEQPKGWWLQWVESTPDIKLSWLRYLINDRDPQVRSSSLALLAILCSKAELVEPLVGTWRESPFGLWGACLSISLENSNCDLVRQQALLVLVSLSGVCNGEKKWGSYLTCQPAASEGPLLGQQALEHFLHTHKFFHTVNTSVQSDQLARFSGEIASAVKLIENLFTSTHSPLTSRSTNPSPTEGGTHTHISKESSDKEDLTQFNSQTGSLAHREEVERVLVLVNHLVGSCSPLFVSGVCRLLNNLAIAFPQVVGECLQREGTLDHLTRLVDVAMLRLLLLSSRNRVIRHHCVRSWVRAVGDIVCLLHCLLCVQCTLVSPLLSQPGGLVSRLWGVLSTVTELCSEDTDCLPLCSQVLELMVTLQVSGDSSHTHGLVVKESQKHWINFTKLLLTSLRRADLVALRAHSLKMFSLLLVHYALPPTEVGVATVSVGESLCETTFRRMLDEDYLSDQKTVGKVLCSAIMDARDVSWTDHTAQGTLTESLRLLLLSSFTAKHTALSNGLLESAIDQLKSLGSKVKLEQNDQHIQSNKKAAKESPALSKYIGTLHLLRNFMYQSSEVKSAVADSQLLTVLHKQWVWYSVNKKVLLPVLKLLCVFTARHTRGQVLLSQPAKSVHPAPSPSLLHSALKFCSSLLSPSRKLSSPDLAMAGGLFHLLANCALSQEGRAVIRKVGFVSHMSSLNPKSDKGERSLPGKLSSLWTLFLTNLSFSSDGQQMIIKQSGTLEVLTDLYWSSTGSTRAKSMLTLRNLCFYGPSKTLLASNEQFLSVLSHCLRSEHSDLTGLATSALWALLHNCTKIRNALRQSELVDSLDSLHTKVTAAHKLRGSVSQAEDTQLRSLKMAHSLLH